MSSMSSVVSVAAPPLALPPALGAPPLPPVDELVPPEALAPPCALAPPRALSPPMLLLPPSAEEVPPRALPPPLEGAPPLAVSPPLPTDPPLAGALVQVPLLVSHWPFAPQSASWLHPVVVCCRTQAVSPSKPEAPIPSKNKLVRPDLSAIFIFRAN
jgi:hypothetical protein